MQIVLINILTFLAPQRLFTVIELEQRKANKYNNLFNANDDSFVINKVLCELRTNILKVLSIIQDITSSKRIEQLWDYQFKRLYRQYFKR